MGVDLSTLAHDAVMAFAKSVQLEAGFEAWQEMRDRRKAADQILDGTVSIEDVRELLGRTAATDEIL